MKKTGPRQRSATAHPVALALKRAGPVPPGFVESLRLREWSAIETFAKGNATATELAMLRELLAMCACSIDHGFGPEAQSTCSAAAAVLESFGAVPSPGAPLRMDGTQIQVMRDLQGYHDLQRAAFSWGDYLRVIEQATVMLHSISALVPVESQD